MKTFDFSGKNVLIRVDFNVPQDKTLKITDNTRIKAALPTIMKVVEGGGKAVLMSHLGRPKGKRVAELTLASLVEEIAFLTGRKVHFAKDCIGDRAQEVISKASFGYKTKNLRINWSLFLQVLTQRPLILLVK